MAGCFWGRASVAVLAVSLSAWLGAAVLVFAVTAALFERLPTSQAGDIAGIVLSRFEVLRAVLGGLAAVGGVAVWVTVRHVGWVKWLRSALLLAAVGLLPVEHHVQERVREMRPEFAHLDRDDPARAPFRRMHGLSMGLMAANLLWVPAALALTLLPGERRRPSADGSATVADASNGSDD
jgi:hypothetical protein